MKRGSGGESAALKGLVGYDDDDDDDSLSSSPSMKKEDEGDDNNTSSLDLPLYKLVNDTRPPQRKKRKTVRWADPGMLEEVFLFYENRPVDKEAKLPPDDEEVEEGEEKAAPPPPPSPSSPKLSGLYQPLETVTTVRKAASTLPTTESHLAPGGKKWVASGSSSWWGGPRVVVEREGMAKASVNPHSQHHLGLQDGPYDPNLFEFFCDQCQYTIDKQEIRYECAECPSEFCLCEECYDEMGSTHPHPCTLNRLPFHITLMDKTTVAT